MRLFLGIDGGQSGTEAVIGDATGRILGRGSAGPCNHVGAAEGRGKLTRAVTGSLAQALAAADLLSNSLRFEAACCGMSGGPDDKREILAELLPADRLEVTTDAHIALTGALGGFPGAIVIAGTGSIALAETSSGRTARAGGWGYVFGDEGGAFDLVRQALRAALREEEGWGPPSTLHQKLLQATGARDANAVLHLFYTSEWPRARVAALAPLVEEAAVEGDSVAADLLVRAGESLAELARAAGGSLFGDVIPRIALVGGVFESERVRQAFIRTAPGDVKPPLHAPAVGALLRAWRSAGLKVEVVE
ncbi:MAG: ATPase [Acidobacteria bacterium]|nr:ATPase [Acidobacteriota bacterium]